METTITSEKPATRSKEEITQLIDLWHQSGKSKKRFCQENNLVYMTFIGWTAPKKKAKTKPSAFVPLKVNKISPGIFAEINLPGGRQMIFHSPVSAEYLKEVLR